MENGMLELAVEAALRRAPAAAVAVVVEEASAHAVSYALLRAKVEALRPRLRSIGVGPGRVLSIFTARTPEAIALTFAAAIEGAVFYHYETQYGLEQLRAVAPHAVTLVVDDHGLAELTRAKQPLEPLRPIYLPNDVELSGPPRAPRAPPADLATLADDAAVLARRVRHDATPVTAGAASLCFTSGSTGRPKGILTPGQAYVANAFTDGMVWSLRAEDRILNMVSIGHAFGLNQIFSTLTAGAALHLFAQPVLSRDQWAERMRAIVDRSGITGFSLGASLFHSFVAGCELLFGPKTSLRFVSLGGAPLTERQQGDVVRALGPEVAVIKTYGQGEVNRIAMLDVTAPENAARAASVGRPVPGCRVFITRDRTTVEPPGEVGEVAVLSASRAMLRYLDDEVLTRARLGSHPAFPGETVVYTGDHGHLDDDGYLFLDGRRDGVFKRNWVLVYPSVVEDGLRRHPDVGEAVVFSVQRRAAIQSTSVVAIVRARRPITGAALIPWARDNLPPSHAPDDVRVWEELPTTGIGKLDRAQIRRRYLAEQCEWDVDEG